MFARRKKNEIPQNYSFPQTKLRNVICIHCKHQFFLRGYQPLEGFVPLLLQCGHVVCETCAKEFNNSCQFCNNVSQDTDNKAASLPINIYALGLALVSQNRSVNTDDSDISFQRSINPKQRNQPVQELCQECGLKATVRCPQCDALFCLMCYSKIHGRALQGHPKIVLSEKVSEGSPLVRTVCSKECNEALSYYCKVCDVPGCSHCMLRSHAKHETISLIEKNQELLPEFHSTCSLIDETRQRIQQARKKLQTTRMPQTEPNVDGIEASVNQHFAQLHGVLQNVERKIVNDLNEYRNRAKKNVDEIGLQLKNLEDELQDAAMSTPSIVKYLGKVDLEEIIGKLEKLADVPCFLIQHPEPEMKDIRFDVDKTITAAMENHYTLQIPPVAGFTLQSKKSLPDNYEIEPLNLDTAPPKIVEPPKKSASPTVTVPRSTCIAKLVEGSSEMVRVTNVVDPACFYVQQISAQNELEKLSKELTTFANRNQGNLKSVTNSHLYIMQKASDKMWYRGRIVNRKVIIGKEEETYDILLVDYGTKEENVTLSRMKTLPPQFQKLPVMAVKCGLHDVVPNEGKWNPDATEAFKKLTADSIVSMHVLTISSDTYYVDLCVISAKDSGLTSVTESLTYMKHASRVTPHKLMRMNPESGRKYYKEQLDCHVYTEVDVLFIESPSCIYVQKAERNVVYFRRLVDEMTADYERNMTSSGYIHVPEKDLPCAARGVDGHWYRGLIAIHPTENTVKVFYVDLGYTLVLHHDDIRTLSPKYMNCRTQAIQISLRSVQPLFENNGEWSSDAIDFVHEFLDKAGRVKIIPYEKIVDTYSVFLYGYLNKSNLAMLLLEKGLAQKAGMGYYDAKSVRKYKKKNNKHKKPQNDNESDISLISNFTSKSEVNFSIRTEELQDIEDPYKICVLVHEIQSPDNIYVSDATSEESFAQMNLQMQEFYKKCRSKEKRTWNKDDVCVVYSTIVNTYYRAKILEIKSKIDVVVFFYDVGTEETVTIKNIQSLHQMFFDTPAHVFKIKLAGVLPCGGSSAWPSLSCEELRNIINAEQNRDFYISKLFTQEEVEDGAISVELWVKQVKVVGPLTPTRVELNSVNRLLVEKGVALPIKDYAKKRDKILAIELKRQLQKRLKMVSGDEVDVEWIDINSGQPDGSLIEKSTAGDVLMQNLLLFSRSKPINEDTANGESGSDSSELTDWLPADPIVEDHFIAIPTYLDHDGVLYLHSKTHSAKTLQCIETKLSQWYQNCRIQKCDTEWAPGDLCIAQYHANKKWYRGKVLKILANDLIEVLFVDYGNIEECAIGTLKKKIILENVPVQCTKCVIQDLKPPNNMKKWTIKELDKIHALLVDQECEVSVTSRTDTHLVAQIIMLPNKKCPKRCDVITFLKNECRLDVPSYDEAKNSSKSSATTETPDVVLETEEVSSQHEALDDVVISGHSVLVQKNDVTHNDEMKEMSDCSYISWREIKKEIATSTPEEDFALSYKELVIPPDTELIEIELCVSIGATKFYAQLKENAHCTVLNNYYTLYQLLTEDLQENASKQQMITNFAPNTPCCAKYSDGIWYRSRIVESEEMEDTDEVAVKLLYVDFGNYEYRLVNTESSNLHCLKKEWYDVPIMALKCRLWNVDFMPTSNSELVMSTLPEMYNVPVVAKIKGSSNGFTNVELYTDMDCKELMYASLIEEGAFAINE